MACASKALIAIAALATTPLIGGCSRNSDTVIDQSEPPQIFYDPPSNLPKYPHKRLSREPGRLIETPLRPSRMTARLPSAYLRAIGHPWEPYAKEIWDFADFGFDLDRLSPAPVDQIGDIRNPGRFISIELGGYSRTNAWKKSNGFLREEEISKSDLRETVKAPTGHIEHIFYSRNESEFDGNPALVSCFKVCNVTLTITPDMAGMPSEPSTQKGYGPAGIALKISFDETLIARWPEIRAQALCFAAASISGLGTHQRDLNIDRDCLPVRKAIADTMQS